LLAPAHQLLAAEARVGTQEDRNVRPTLPDLRHDALDFLARPGGRIKVRSTQLRAQQMFAREDIQRQVTVVVVVAMKEPTLLMPVQWIISGVQIQHDLSGRLAVSVQEQLHPQPLDRCAVRHDLVIAIHARRRRMQLQAVQRALARQRRALGSTRRRKLAQQRTEHRIVPQLLVVVEVLIPQRHAEHALAEQGAHAVFNQIRIASIAETAC
jgi:hypothetical protein